MRLTESQTGLYVPGRATELTRRPRSASNGWPASTTWIKNTDSCNCCWQVDQFWKGLDEPELCARVPGTGPRAGRVLAADVRRRSTTWPTRASRLVRLAWSWNGLYVSQIVDGVGRHAGLAPAAAARAVAETGQQIYDTAAAAA